MRYLLDDFLACFTGDTKAAVNGLKTCGLDELVFIREEYLIPYLSYVRDNKDVFGTALRHDKTLGFEAVYQRMFENIFDPILERFCYSPDMRQYVMMYYLNGIHAIVVEWLKNSCDKPIGEVAEIISVCIYGKEYANG